METWNAYTADGHLTDHTLTRGEAIPDGLYHLVVECIIRHRDGSTLFMQRDSTKPSYPDYYEATAGGSALFGEIAEQAIVREVREETGIELTATQLRHHTHFVAHDDQCLFHCYWAETDWDKSAIQLQAEETSHYIWVPQEKLKNFLETELVIPRQKDYVERLFLEQEQGKSENETQYNMR
ncbi:MULTISPECIES: NUDIX hydrolase [Streptococcus]|uniref:NUDIX hydrolase n=1 Tax=Streptococcus TaxID=1301 RepID=UPI000CF63661|nr:NUDIX hydrolase [Streptococcus suis]MBM7312013.1 NUDIX hydrolase [Streptococcus suis]MBM7318610.1 NUDIX hydrolase [Streptococcus suis]MBY4964202.1 NUDIX hydrolase [Streptococcus suis]MCO8241614.1 NUDIX hydrolase [Streptococcus suis]TII10052.1 NUDIX hydrolase [Streptococcus suis]